ncbi:response regulator [Paenibacillus flagellatus]|uniref:Two-component system response regulator n=1 Tax=Paenibacillus flagellatus TaxID=2211139 RepID=A0A2V5JV23_9BACL|nr:response regulator [Paenibacillus flagellatus]PYI50509.1 two-component system response regulator [Paenibacillus flagellatus]
MNLLIVEDEIRLCNSLANNMPWEQHGIEIVGMAHNGLDALDLIERKKPELLLLDISIPGADGLTVARKVHEQRLMTKIIILSGHDNFTYAQKALEFGVSKYLLKPAGETEIMEAVLHAAEQLRRELELKHSQEALQEIWRHNLPNLQNNFFIHWLNGKFVEWEVTRRSQDVQLELDREARYAVVAVDMDPVPEEETRFTPRDLPVLQFSLGSIAKEVLPDYWVCSDPGGATALIYKAPPDKDANAVMLQINTDVTRLLSNVKECLKLTASAGICRTTGSRDEVPELYRQAVRALQNRIVYGGNIAIPFREEPGHKPVLPTDPNLEKSLEIALQTGDEAKAEETLDQLWGMSGIVRAESMDDVQENVMFFGALLIRIMQKQGWPFKELAGDDFAFFLNPQSLGNKEQIHAMLLRVVRRAAAYVKKERMSVSHQIVKQLLGIVEEEMDQEISLHQVADRLFVNSSYLSRLFKQETGKSFSAYVIERKMERAKAALLDGAKIGEAAAMVGYHDGSYFTRVFRKYWGVTPGEVRP